MTAKQIVYQAKRLLNKRSMTADEAATALARINEMLVQWQRSQTEYDRSYNEAWKQYFIAQGVLNKRDKVS